MKLHTCARGLLAGAISVTALVGSTGVAAAQPDHIPPPAPGKHRTCLWIRAMKAVHPATGVVSECTAKIYLSGATKKASPTNRS
jgi:hypothetical protein